MKCGFCGQKVTGFKQLYNHWDNKLCPKHPRPEKRMVITNEKR